MDIKTWKDLQLSQGVCSTIDDLGFTSLTPVQAACIPVFLSKKDVAVEAVTGSGKTLSFLVPMFEILLKYAPVWKQDVVAIIISPTRELAAQTAEIVETFLKYIKEFTSILIIGGGTSSADISNMSEKGANIIIATPGRLAALFALKTLNLAAHVKTLEILILDEADKLLEMGFEKTINTILGYLPKQRLTGLFSATQTKEIEDLIRAGLRNPVCISVKEKSCNSSQRTPSTLSNFYMVCEADKKLSTLLWFLMSKGGSKCMVFFSTCASVDYFSCILKQIIKNIPVISIHGKMKKKRHNIFSEYKNSDSGILLCTDVMARGVDIPDVNWVIQFDPPSSASSFVHRCGRTARIGKTGNALIMLLPTEESFVNFLDVNQKVHYLGRDVNVPIKRNPVIRTHTQFFSILNKVTLENLETPSVPDLTEKIKKLAAKNREIYEKGMRAFVSFIRFYSKHECSLLFRIKDLDLGKLANGYALLKMPRMPELKNKVPPNFQPVEVNFENIPYLDKHREKQRQVKLKEFKENPKNKKGISERKEEWLKMKRLRAKKKLEKKRKKNKPHEYTEEDLDELARDARLLKKFKSGKISKEEFDEQFAPDIDED